MLSWMIHYKNKYPGAHIIATENSVDVFVGTNHKVALRKDGGGNWGDQSVECGCDDQHDLAPIPRDARVHKLQSTEYGKTKAGVAQFRNAIGRDEAADKREKLAQEFQDDSGKIMSIADLSENFGYVFESNGDVRSRPDGGTKKKAKKE